MSTSFVMRHIGKLYQDSIVGLWAVAHACNSSTGEVEKGKLKSIDSLGYTFAFKKKELLQSAKQSAGCVTCWLPHAREHRKAAFPVCSEWESKFDRKPAIRFLEMTTQGSAIAPVLFLISKSAIQLPVHQQEPSAVDNSVCVPRGLGLSSACSWLVI